MTQFFKVGERFKGARCIRDDGYDGLTYGKTYDIEIEQGIFHTCPYASLIDDNGKEIGCHASRFERPNMGSNGLVQTRA